ncbi:MAG: hypothetical protein RDU20_19085 [Desulfomonilaceae bacterium]|nr:hypothetical protein [Desulfomonilaceae bacterium]
MKRVVVSAKQLIADIRDCKPDRKLMRDYRLSQTGLMNIKNELLSRGLISLNELKNQMGSVRTRKKISAERFLYDFRRHPDDFHLMERYGLKAYQLRKVYLSLIKRRLLSDFEYQSRAVRAPEVDEERRPAPALGRVGETSTIVSVVQQCEDPEADFIHKYRDTQLPPDFFKDYSGISIGGRSPSDLPDLDITPVEVGPSSSPGSEGRRRAVVQIMGGNSCPNCGALTNPASQDSCLSCGVIYEKVHSRPKVVSGVIRNDD